MNLTDPAALSALGHPGRLAVFRLLARRAPEGVRPSEIAAALELKPNTLSVYVGTLAAAGLVTTWREGQSVFYGVALDRVAELVAFLVNDCCRGRPDLCVPLAAHALGRLDQAGPLNVLFVCTGNSARSVFAQVLLNERSEGRFRGFSAGTKPARLVHPKTLATLRHHGHPIADLSPTRLADFSKNGAPRIDLAITLCDVAANEECPALPGLPVTSHWGIPDPAAAAPDEEDAAFETAYRAVEARIAALAASDMPATPLDLQRLVDAIGRETARTGELPKTTNLRTTGRKR